MNLVNSYAHTKELCKILILCFPPPGNDAFLGSVSYGSSIFRAASAKSCVFRQRSSSYIGWEFWPPNVDPVLASWVPLLHLQMNISWEAGVGTNLRDLFSYISTRMNEGVIKKPKQVLLVMLVGFGGLCSRAFTFWVVKKEKSLPGCPAQGKCRTRALPMEFPRFSRILASFKNMRKLKHRKTTSEWTGGQHTHQSALPCLALVLWVLRQAGSCEFLPRLLP